MNDERGQGEIGAVLLLGMAAVFVLVLIGVGMWGFPQYGVYKQELDGKAKLAEAQYSRQVAIAEARAKEESATHLASAEIERAKGVAQANQIIGESLKGNEAYLRYLWIDGLQTNQMQVVYVPTEAGLPLLEAGRRPREER